MGSIISYLGSYNGVDTLILQRLHVGGEAMSDADAFEVLVLEHLAHVGMRLNGDDLVPLISGGQELGELSSARRQIHDCGLGAVGDAYAVEQDRDAVCGERRAMLVIQSGIAKAALRRWVELTGWSGRHDDSLKNTRNNTPKMCKESTGINVMNRGFSRETDKRREQMVEKMVGTNKVERWFDVKQSKAS